MLRESFARCLFWFLAVFLILGACSHRLETPSEQFKLRSGEDVPNKSCNEEVMCTMEFAPSTCTFKGQTFRGSNRCQAMKELRRYACEKKLDFDVNLMSCQLDSEAESGPHCGEQPACTREYRPHVCTFDGQKMLGSNRCEALRKVRNYACAKSLNFRAQDVPCEPTEPAGEE